MRYKRSFHMPPKAKISKEMILEAAVNIVREQGHEMINARTIADRLKCSTQPVLYHFKTIDEIREAAYKIVEDYHGNYIAPKGDRGLDPLLELGLNYIRFGYEEKNLFRFLFQTNTFAGLDTNDLMSNEGLTEILKLVSAESGSSVEAAKEIFFSLFVTAHGIASLLANNAMEYEEEHFRHVLENCFNNQTEQR